MKGVSHEDSEVVDLFAICARPSASPAGDLRPPDLFSVAPPAVTTDIGDEGDDTLARLFAKKSRAKLALAGGAAALLCIGLVIVGVTSGSAEPTKARVAAQLPAAAPLPLPPAAVEVPAAPAPQRAAIPLPAPPTTGAPLPEKPPQRVAQASPAKARAPAAGGPKMTKVQSGGVAGH